MKLYRCTKGHWVSHPQPRSEAINDEDGPWHCPYPCMEDTKPNGDWIPARFRGASSATTPDRTTFGGGDFYDG